jgi:hypothetical protein
METDKQHIPWTGIVLIILGAALLLDRLHVLNIDFSNVFWTLIMLIGIVGVGRGFARNRRGKIFFGTIFFLYGMFFFLRSLDFVELHAHMLFPATLVIFGIAFLMIYLANFRDWFLLIPALFFGGVGVAFMLTELGYLYRWEVWEAVRLYWPIVLILFGVALIFRCRLQQPTDQVTS